MPPPETFHRHQTAVLWEKVGDDAQGEPILSQPVELSPCDGTGVRWESGDLIPLTPQMDALKVEAVVVVNRDIAFGSQMWLGTLDHWNGTGSADSEFQDVLWVVRTVNVPDLKNRIARREVWLSKFRQGHGTLTS